MTLPLIGLAAVIVAIGAARLLLVVVTVTGDSMAPALHRGDRVLVVRGRTKRRGAIVVLAVPSADRGHQATPPNMHGQQATPPNEHGHKAVPPGNRDRLAMPPNERGRRATRPNERDQEILAVKRLAATAGDRMPALVRGSAEGGIVPQGHVFVLGDADASLDSRTFGPLPYEALRGRVLARLSGGRGRIR